MKKLAITIIISSFVLCAPKSGTITETDSGIVGKVSYSTGTGAAHARVQLFGARDTSRIALSSSSTDQNGNYDFHKLTPGAYNVWIESQDSLLALIDSVYVPQDSEITANATLYKGGSVTAIVALQPGHNPTSVFVQALGTQRYSNVNDSGWFSVKGLAQGEYTLRLVSTIPGYTPTYKTITIASGVNDTLKDTIYMVYSGIPIVNGIQAVFDEYTGVAKISWRKLTYKDFYEYKVYREEKGVLNPQPVLIAVSPDSCFVYDTLYRPKVTDSVYDAGDTLLGANVNYRYRVTIVNKSMDEGQKYEFADVAGRDPAGLVKIISPVPYERFKDSIGLSCAWGKVSSAAKYQVQISKKADFSSTVLDSLAADTSLQLPMLGMNYYYLRIRAKNSNGQTGYWGMTRKFAVVGDLFATEIPGTDNLSPGQMIPTSDNGFLFSANDTLNHNWVLKTDSLGKVQWKSSELGFRPGKLIQTSDGGFLLAELNIVVLYNSIPQPGEGAHIIRLDQNGKVVWLKIIQYTIVLPTFGVICPWIKDILLLPDDSFVFAFYGQNIYKDQTTPLLLMKYDNLGEKKSEVVIDSCSRITKIECQFLNADTLFVGKTSNVIADTVTLSIFDGSGRLSKVNSFTINQFYNLSLLYGNRQIYLAGYNEKSSSVLQLNSQLQGATNFTTGGNAKLIPSANGYLCIVSNSTTIEKERNISKLTTAGLNLWTNTCDIGPYISYDLCPALPASTQQDGSVVAVIAPKGSVSSNLVLFKISSSDGRSFENLK